MLVCGKLTKFLGEKKMPDTPMKRLFFGEGLMEPVLWGEKLFTVRVYREESHNFREGEIVKGEFKDGLTILLQIVRDTKKDLFKKLKQPKKGLDSNGYYFDAEYLKDLKTFYPDITWDTVGAIIFFEVLKVNGVPVVKFNELGEFRL
jgi:hypothetical protein